MRAATLSIAVVLTLSWASPATLGAAQDHPFATITLERIAGVAGDPAHQDRRALQFLRADAKGRLYLLRSDTLAVDQLQPSGRFAPHGRPPAGQAAADDPVTDAALSLDGSTWLLLRAPERLALLGADGPRELPLSHWAVSALAYGPDGPLIAVLPARVGAEAAEAPPTAATWDRPPLLLRLGNQAWQPLVFGESFKRHDPRPLLLQEIKGERDSRLAIGPKGALWLAQQDAYLLRRFSRMGVLQESLSVAGGHVQWKERTADDWKQLEQAAQAGGLKLNRARLANVQAVRVVRGLTAHEQRVYLVVDTPAGLALDRWDTDTRELDRIVLSGASLRPGPVSVAAGRDGLYLAGALAGNPVWRLDWQRLDDAKWLPVPEAFREAARAN